MSIEICEECKTEFRYVEIGGGQPSKPEIDDIQCPSCGHQRWELTTGYFQTEGISQK